MSLSAHPGGEISSSLEAKGSIATTERQELLGKDLPDGFCLIGLGTGVVATKFHVLLLISSFCIFKKIADEAQGASADSLLFHREN